MTNRKEIRVSQRFQRAIRVDTDLGDPAALHGFVCPPSFAHALNLMVRHMKESGQGAFTWTGPYGSGKSSLAVVLGALLGGKGAARNKAVALTEKTGRMVVRTLRPGAEGYRFLGVVGRRQNCASLIVDALVRENLIDQPLFSSTVGNAELLDTLRQTADNPNHAGLVVVIDELGQVLEAAAQGRGDLHILQELAEVASRSRGRLTVIGILHQAFAEYTSRLAQQTRSEWQKIQGRFVDLPIAPQAHEQLVLLSEAIGSNPPDGFEAQAKKLAGIIEPESRERSSEVTRTLVKCWPLNPVAACLLGPWSRRRFGQNQRSIFSFLNSAESLGFQDFLKQAQPLETYRPALFWDYLRTNLEPAILASPDGHRWATAIDALQRCEQKIEGGGETHLFVAKTVAVIDQFREQLGFRATPDIIRLSVPSPITIHLETVLQDLQDWSIIVYRRHLGAYAVFAGSDFDIEAAIKDERSRLRAADLASCLDQVGLRPITANRHYLETGALRWLDVDVAPLDHASARAAAYQQADGALGLLLLVLPSDNLADTDGSLPLQELCQDHDGLIAGAIAANGPVLLDLVEETAALLRIRDSHAELRGDAVARKEVDARLETARLQAAATTHKELLSAVWVRSRRNFRLPGMAAMHRFASELADETYAHSPKIRNELLNRTRPSSSATAARRQLLYAMALGRGQPHLGIEGFPAEGGLCQSLLEATGLYRADPAVSDQPGFLGPTPTQDPSRLVPLWQAADNLLTDMSGQPVSLAEVYSLWQAPPYGVNHGLLPVLALAYVLSRLDRLAVYLDDVIQPELDDFLVDRLLQDAGAVQIRQMEFTDMRVQVLTGINDIVFEHEDAQPASLDPLMVARRLVALVMSLPPWTLRTAWVSPNAQHLRSMIRTAYDPNRLLFDDLPRFVSVSGVEPDSMDADHIVALIRDGLQELTEAYRSMLSGMKSLLLEELDAAEDLAQLNRRAHTVRDLTGDLKLDAFAVRLESFVGSNTDMEGLVSLATSKPPRDWVDRDLDAARIELADLAQQFNRSEAFARVKGRLDRRHAIAFVTGMAGTPHTLSREFDISTDEVQAARRIACQLKSVLQETGVKNDIALAALVQVGSSLMNTSESEDYRLTAVREE